MKNKLICTIIALIIIAISSGCNSMLLEEGPSSSSSSLPPVTTNYEGYVDNFSSQETAGQYDSLLPYAFCVDENSFDIKKIVYFQVLNFDKQKNKFVYAFQAPLKQDDKVIITRLMEYTFDVNESYGTPGSQAEYAARIKNSKVFFEARSGTASSTLDVLKDDNSAKDLGSTVIVSGEQSMYASKLPYSNGYFLYIGGYARYFNENGACYRVVNLGDTYNLAVNNSKAKDNMINEVKPMYIDGIESIALSATFTDYVTNQDTDDVSEEDISKKTHGVVFIYQMVSLNGANFHKSWKAGENKDASSIYTSSISIKGYDFFSNRLVYSNNSELKILGGGGTVLPQNCNIDDPYDCRTINSIFNISGSIKSSNIGINYKTVKDDKGNETTVPESYDEYYYLSENSYLLLSNYIYNTNLVLNAVNSTEILCFDNKNAYWLKDNGDITPSWVNSSAKDGSIGRIKQDALLSSNVYTKNYVTNDEDAIHSAIEINNGFALFTSDNIFITLFNSINNVSSANVRQQYKIDFKKLNFAKYNVDMASSSSKSSSINYQSQSSRSKYEVDFDDNLSSQGDASDVDPNAEAPNPDAISSDGMLYLNNNNYLFSGIYNGAILFNSDTGETKQVLKAAIYKTWKLADNSYLAVGFDTGKQRYTISDLSRAHIIRYKI